jgi:dGTPase
MLKQFVWKMILSDEHVTTLERKGQLIVRDLFKELTNANFDNNIGLLPKDFREKITTNDEDYDRVVCDYIAGMTDNYAIRLYSRMMESDIHSVFEIL